ncbi:MAG: DUF3788 family protein [Fidelibacterota bacterium]|nr:MAG: DUF3788 family protein [Candidatus Neomarinimicrobiota bacterium]
MPSDNPITNPKSRPTKGDLEDFLGRGRYQRFEKIYDELVELGLEGQFLWNKFDKNWSLRFLDGKKPLFKIRWGIDYFYAYLILQEDTAARIVRHKKITPDALRLVRKHSPNAASRTVRIEANLEKIVEQEGFFDLLPILLKLLG